MNNQFWYYGEPFFGGYHPVEHNLPVSDEQILETISNALVSNPVTVSADTNVQVKNHVVTLEGSAPNRHVKQAAGHIAWITPGVHDVYNHIRIQRHHHPSH